MRRFIIGNKVQKRYELSSLDTMFGLNYFSVTLQYRSLISVEHMIDGLQKTLDLLPDLSSRVAKGVQHKYFVDACESGVLFDYEVFDEDMPEYGCCRYED